MCVLVNVYAGTNGFGESVCWHLLIVPIIPTHTLRPQFHKPRLAQGVQL